MYGGRGRSKGKGKGKGIQKGVLERGDGSVSFAQIYHLFPILEKYKYIYCVKKVFYGSTYTDLTMKHTGGLEKS